MAGPLWDRVGRNCGRFDGSGAVRPCFGRFVMPVVALGAVAIAVPVAVSDDVPVVLPIAVFAAVPVSVRTERVTSPARQVIVWPMTPRLLKWIDIPPVWLFAALVIAWLQGQGASTGLLRLIGSGLLLLGLALMAAAIVQMVIARTTPVPHMQPNNLVSSGIFGLSRNPIYLGDLLVLAGCCLRWDAWLSLIFVPVLGWVLTRRFILPEEARLKQAFGTAFDAYAAKTRRWI